jgi:hypothetical protein
LDLKKFPFFLMADIVSDLQTKLSDRPSSGTATLSGDANGLLLLDQIPMRWLKKIAYFPTAKARFRSILGREKLTHLWTGLW